MTIYKQIERESRRKILEKIKEIEGKYGTPADSSTAGKMLDELLEIIKLAHKNKIMFGMPYGLVHGMLSEEEKKRAVKETSLIGHLIKNLELIKKQNLTLGESEASKMGSLFSEISSLIATGTYVGKDIVNTYNSRHGSTGNTHRIST